MTYNPDIHHRRSVRLREYDYSASGAYFITICAQGRECLFGEISGGQMALNDAGAMVASWWLKLPDKFPGIAVDGFMVMPNHFHGIIVMHDRRGDPCDRPPLPIGEPCDRPVIEECRGESCIRPDKKGDHKDRPYGTVHNSVGRIVQAFKSFTTVEYIRGVNEKGWPPFPGRLWQRNYYERVVRDEGELAAIREYIRGNPVNWAKDEEHPDRV